MKTTYWCALLEFVTFIVRISAGAQSSTSSVRSPAGNTENGKRLYLRDGCYQCRGYAGQGGRAGARIAAWKFNAQALILQVRRPPGDMPAYSKKVIWDQELTDICAYLKTFPPAKASKEIPLLDQLRDR